MSKQFCICKCFFTNNIFLKDYKLHATYRGKDQFLQEYSQVLKSKGCHDPHHLISQLESECLRRRQLHNESWSRQLQVAKEYAPKHPHIFTLQTSFLDPKFVDLVQHAQEPDTTAEDSIRYMEKHQNRIFSFPVFTAEFCKTFVEELDNYERCPLPKGRPNTMNQYGIKLDELGFDSFISELRTKYLTPLTKLLYPDWGGEDLDSHKAFIVTYKEGADVDLNYHYDNAEVTLNVSLNDDYCDGDLYFGPMRTEESSFCTGYPHQLGHGLLHRGQQLHGAFPITEGFRYNLIIWMRSSGVRNYLCPMCDEKPDLLPVKHGYGDGFTITTADVCSAS